MSCSLMMTVSTDNRPVLVICGAADWSVRLVGGGYVIGVEADGMSTAARKFPSQIFEKIVKNVLRGSAPHFGPCVSVKKCDDTKEIAHKGKLDRIRSEISLIFPLVI